MSLNTITPAKADDFIPEIWSSRALTVLEAELHLAKNVARDSEFTTQKVGDTLNIAKTGAMTANAKVAGSPVTLQNPDSTGVNVTLSNHYEVSFLVDDVVAAQENQSTMDRYIGDGITALAEKIETTLASLYGSLTASTVNSGGGSIVDADLLSCRGNLSSNRAPAKNRFLYLDPDAVNDVLTLSKFTSQADYGAKEPVQEGELGKIYGFRTFESLFVQSAGSPAVNKNLYMHRDAMILAMRPLKKPRGAGAIVSVAEYKGLMLRVIYAYNAMYTSDQVTIDALWGVSTLRPELGGVIESS